MTATTALILAPRAAVPFADGTVTERLAGQLASLGVSDVREAHDLSAITTLAREARGAVVVLDGGIVTQRTALAGVVADPRVGTGALTGPPGTFRGVLKVAAADREALADAAEHAEYDDVAGLYEAVVSSGTRVAPVDLRGFFWAHAGSAEAAAAAERELPNHDEDRIALEAAVKASDGFFTTFFVSPYSRYIARWCAHRGFTPNQVTTASMALGLVAAAAFATGERAGLIAGAIVLQAAFTLDCVDGQLARYTRRFSALGGWLDSVFDRGKEYAVYAGLAIGSARAGDPVWVLAGAALALQTVRHFVDFSWLEVATTKEGSGAVAAWQATDRVPVVVWIKKIIAFPIGERFAVISLAAALTDARTTFVVVLAWGGFALLYGLAGRVLRSVSR